MTTVPLVAAAALALAGCTGTTTTSTPAGSTAGSAPTGSATAASGPTGTAAPAACTRPAETPPAVTDVASSARDHMMTSFDGTQIRIHWFPNPSASPGQPAPTVLMGPGWGIAGDTDESAVGVLGVLNISTLQKAGYNVATWDPRGFGQSGGSVEVDSADYEGKDVQRLIDWIATQDGVQLDRDGDPRVGMIGGSYGGGIQFVTAANDCRVDTIVPVIAWHSLATSLYKADTVKSGWSNVLTGVAAGRSLDPHITSASQEGNTTGVLSDDNRQWFTDRGPDGLLDRIHVPTLIVQGTVDGLFTLDEGVSNYRALRDRGVTTSMVWFCGGHGTCLTPSGDPTRVDQAGLAWLARYLKDDTSVDTGPRIQTVDQDGAVFHADDYPLANGPPIAADGTGTLTLTADGGSGPAPSAPIGGGIVDNLALAITPAKATNAVEVPIDTGATSVHVVGAPQVKLSYTGTAGTGDKPTRVFAQLVDDATGIVLGNQVTPIDVNLDGKPHEVTTPLEIVSYTTHPGQHVTLQLVTTTVAYAVPQLGGSIDFTGVHVELPVATNLQS